MSHYDHNLESEQPLFEKPVYSNISNSHSREMPNGHHHHHHHHNNHHSGMSSSSSSNHNHDHDHRALSPGMGDDMDSSDPKTPQDLQLMLQTQNQAVEARVSKLQSRLLILGGVTIIGFNIIIVLCAVFFTKLHYDIAHHTHKPKLGTQMAAILQEGLCVPCEDFRLGPSREEEMKLERYKDESSGSGKSARCCVDKPGDLLELLKLVSISQDFM
ncbi:TNF ligand-like 2 [Elysia marginata]|uniref:TNF ligand-like 2 n=1 Tax=Elysia marginata TaxID=1093978 RepID=A0AAV4IPI0_9GAST|nr:TNF ligand-like 2 [Elysia marginata]